MQIINQYPVLSPIKKDFRDELHPLLNMVEPGISEFTFAGLYLFRKTYQYKLSWLPDGKLLLHGIEDGEQFYSLPLGFPENTELRQELLQSVGYIKNINESHADELRIWVESIGFTVCEDRDNFDYIYRREDLVTLRGKKYHKKRNQVNAFINSYSYEERLLNQDNINDAFIVLDTWREERGEDGDYTASKEALELKEFLGLNGYIVYIDGQPAAYTMGESIAGGTTYVIHIEKAISQYKGIYQFINQAYASVLPKNFHYINREQDLGKKGLRQAKMTYRPNGFIKKYRICKKNSIQIPFHTTFHDK